MEKNLALKPGMQLVRQAGRLQPTRPSLIEVNFAQAPSHSRSQFYFYGPIGWQPLLRLE